MGLLDYYRQFDDVDQESINKGLRERRRRGRELALAAVPTIDLASDGGADTDALLAAVTESTRVVVLCNPNDPTGSYMPAERVAALARALPEHVHLLVDEAYVEFQDVEPRDSVLRLVDAFPR